MGKGKTASAVADYLYNSLGIKDVVYIVEDEFANNYDESLSAFLENNEDGRKFIVYGFSNYDRALTLDREIFSPNGIKNFFIPLPFSYNETRRFIDKEYFDSHKVLFFETRKMLQDEARDLYDAYIDAVVTGEMSILDHYREDEKEQYFKKDCVPHGKVIFIDVGAYTGDTIVNAVSRLEIEKYIAIEPDEKNVSEIYKSVNENEINIDIDIVESGVWDCNTILRFRSAGSSSGVEESGDVEIAVIKIDDLMVKLKDSYSVFVKMDIEGSELRALKGMKNLIKKHKPYMAVSVYHRIDDLISIPQYIEEIAPEGYLYRLGYYGNNFRELVLYVTPKDKGKKRFNYEGNSYEN